MPPDIHYFDLDIPKALVDQLVLRLDGQALSPMTRANIDAISGDAKGVYVIYQLAHLPLVPVQEHSDLLIAEAGAAYPTAVVRYVGKARELRDRLRQHHRKLSGRVNVDIAHIAFKYLVVSPNWSASVPEEALIEHFEARGEAEWNGNGFGPKDQGQYRDDTRLAGGHFDKLYPINVELICDWITPGEWTVRALLRAVKPKLPFLLRFETSSRQADLSSQIQVRADRLNVIHIMEDVIDALPAGWQATVFPWQVILYPKDATYHEQIRVIRRADQP